jgi:hypothetical protein
MNVLKANGLFAEENIQEELYLAKGESVLILRYKGRQRWMEKAILR